MSSSKIDHPNRIPSDRYLWATTPAAKYIRVGEKVNERYQVVAPQIWQDLRPELLPEMPTQLSDILPYLRLYPHRLHVPEVYGVCQVGDSVITLLENVPIDRNAELYPSMMSIWTKAPAVRQVYWLWQMLGLWTPLAELGVASSLLIPDNLRVEGWRIRLRELDLNPVKDRELAATTTGSQLNTTNPATETASDDNPAPTDAFESATLQQLGACWASWCRKASVSVASQLEEIATLLQTENPSLPDITNQLNQVLIEQSSRQPLRLQIAGATDSGPRHQHNEDSCYPKMADLPLDLSQPRDPLIPHLSIVCDGIGGHEGGEVASQLAVETIKLQVRALLAEIAEDPEIMPPDLVAQHLSATIRVANNLIASRNDEQQRESRRRMATTLTMALQLPQIVKLPDGQGNAHELYIASVGDSRAYWITSRYCQLLTVDDDVATREVRLGRSLYRQALQRPDAKALTQAVGTRDAELLRPTVQRFILEEDGLLLLCTDGLSDNLSLAAPTSQASPRLTYDWLEELCADYPRDIFSGKLSLEAAVRALIEQANQKNGHDNTSIVLTYCAVSPQYPVVLNLGEGLIGNHAYSFNLDTEFTILPQDLESPEPVTPEETAIVPVKSKTEWFKVVLGISGVLLVLLTAGAALMTAQLIINPEAFKQMQERFFPQKEQPTTTQEDSTTTPPTTL
ncbi:MAG: protein phosphatase 2C domain-containing protein [Coleofasciculaceae cyanobacterium]